MFQACPVKMAKMAANSNPRICPGKRETKKAVVKARKLITGTDWRMSSKGTSTTSARRLFTARDP
jgi:hypothetical protein